MRALTVLVVALVVCNLLLVGLLLSERGSLSIVPTADAQVLSRGGKYLAVTGNYTSSRMCLYLIDETKDRMLIYVWDDTKNVLRRLTYTDLREDFERGERTVETSR